MKNLLLFLVFISSSALCQTEAITKDGRKVSLHADGTWKYVTDQIKPDTSSCDFYVKKVEDKVSGDIYFTNKERIILTVDNKELLNVCYLKTPNNLVFCIDVFGGSNCIEEGGKCIILFMDGTRIEMANETSFNCKHMWMNYLNESGKDKECFKMLKEKPIDIIRAYTTSGYVEQKVAPSDAESIMRLSKCIEEASF